MFKNKKRIIVILSICVAIALCVLMVWIFQNSNVEALSKYGSSGDEVTTIQTKLKRWGYYTGNVDGIYGSKTVEAVKYFQRSNGLTEDRNCGDSNFKSYGNIFIIKLFNK